MTHRIHEPGQRELAGKVRMQVIAQWTGGHADALRQSLRMSNETYASYLGVAPRTVANWRRNPGMVPQAHIQGILDTALDKADERAKAQFAVLVGEMGSHPADASTIPGPLDPVQASLNESVPDMDERARIRGVIESPSRLDAVTVANLTQVLYGQRHAEDTLGPSMLIDPMTAQLDSLNRTLRDASGPYKAALMHLVANWTTFVRWLHTALHEYPAADTAFATAEEMADEIGNGVLASTATGFRGYLALLQGRDRMAIRATAAALATPGAHPAQLAYDTLQSAHAYAALGDYREAKILLHKASDLVTNAGEPPASVYWYTEPFLRMNIGLAQQAIGQHRDAIDSIRSSMAELPADQKNAEWVDDYRKALDDAAEQVEGRTGNAA